MTSNDAVVKELIEEFHQHIQPPEEPNPTILDIIDPAVTEDATRDEGVWQQLLVYFLTPTQEHGFENEILSVFLETVEDQTPISNVAGAISSVTIETEKLTSSGGRVDVLITSGNDWFLCIELKVEAEEHGSQTRRYVEADSIGGRYISDFENQYYLYISPRKSNEITAESFEYISWTAIESEWRRLLLEKMNEQGGYSTRGTAQFSEFLKLIRSLATPDHDYYRDVEQARSTYKNLARTLTSDLISGIRESLGDSYDQFRIKKGAYDTGRWTSREDYPAFEHINPKDDYNVISVFRDPLWKVGRNKETIVFEFRLLLRPHLGPPEYQPHPSVGIHLDLRGGNDRMNKLRNGAKRRGIRDELLAHGFRPPHVDAKWHYLTKFVKLDQTDTPVTDILEEFDLLKGYIPELDELAQDAIAK